MGMQKEISKVVKSFKQILECGARARFIEPTYFTGSKKIDTIKILPLAARLNENIKNQWLCMDGKVPIFTIGQIGKLTAMDRQKEITKCFKENKNQFPFGIFEEMPMADDEHTSSVGEDEIILSPDIKSHLSCSYFINESMAKEFFYQIQRQRKIWWMKVLFVFHFIIIRYLMVSFFQFAANPGRFFISEIRTTQDNVQKLSIKSKFNFGNIEMEKIEFLPTAVSQTLWKSDTTVTSNIIRASLCPEVATIGIFN